MLREDGAKMIPLPDACHGPGFFSFPQSRSTPGLNRSLLRHPMRTYRISPARWQSARLFGCSAFPILKTAFQKALFFFLKDGNGGKILVSDACLESRRGILSSHRYCLWRHNFLSGPIGYRLCVTVRLTEYIFLQEPFKRERHLHALNALPMGV